MSNLLARFAENVYWLGRYLERAENLARILDINKTYARASADELGWNRVLELYTDSERFEAAHGPADAVKVLRFYLLDRDNASSITSSVRAARENARSVRHLISTEMWTHINVFHTELAKLTEETVDTTNLSQVSKEIIGNCETFEGIAEGTFLRGEPWCFYQLGKYLERADQTTRILDMGYERLTPAEGNVVAWVHWNVLLRSVCGYHAYRSRHPGVSSPHDIATFLLYDVEFPRAVALCVLHLKERLHDVEQRQGGRREAETETKRRDLEFLLETGPGREITPQVLHRYLDQIQTALGELSSAVSACYFGSR